MSAGGGGGNILRSLKALFRRDLIVTQKSDSRYAERLKRAVTTRFLDTNAFSLLDVPREERVVIGAATTRRLGSMHNPDVARVALDESKEQVESLLSGFSVIVLIGTGGKGTGAGTLFPLAQMARRQKKLVLPIFVQPSFERHEVDKRRYDHALRVAEQFDAAKIRLIEILNDRGYVDADPQPQAVVWERMNRPIARGLRGLLYVLSDLSQVDPSDLSTLFSGQGRLRIGFGEIAPVAGRDPTPEQIDEAVRACWENSYYAFSKPAGTSLVCIQGDWSNVVDARIKSRLAALAMGDASHAPYNPLCARAFRVPPPWNVTALFAEYTGNHPPLEIAWEFERRVSSVRTLEVPAAVAIDIPVKDEPEPVVAKEEATIPTHVRNFTGVWDLALALNRSDASALALAADGGHAEIPIDAGEVRKLLGTLWFRTVFPRFSQAWRNRILAVLRENITIQNHTVKYAGRTVRANELSYEALKQVVTGTILPDPARTDLRLLMTVGDLWGPDAVQHFRFAEPSEPSAGKRGFLQILRT